MKYQIKSRGAVQFECELDAAYEIKSEGVKLGAAVKIAFTAKANLSEANLSGAYLSGAYLSEANLSGAYLSGAYLSEANLSGANLRGADLSGAYLSGANLREANLRGAYLSEAYLRGANLREANLGEADLSGADLREADLSGAKNLTDEQKASAGLRPMTPEEIARMDEVRTIVLSNPERLDMSTWHGAKWDHTHTPEEEHSCGTAHCIAGWLQALSPDEEMRKLEPERAGFKLCPPAARMFYASNEDALEWLTTRGYAK